MKRGRCYGYYVSRSLIVGTADARQGWRVPARQIEDAIAVGIADLLDERATIASAMEEAGMPAHRLPAVLRAAAAMRVRLFSDVERSAALTQLVARAVLGRDRLRVIVSLAPLVGDDGDQKGPTIEREMPLSIRRRGIEMKLVIADHEPRTAAPAPILLKGVVRARRCVNALLSCDAKNLAVLASREGVSDRYISSLLPLAFLAPDIVEAIVSGRQPAELTAHKLIRQIDLPVDWAAQRQILGIR